MIVTLVLNMDNDRAHFDLVTRLKNVSHASEPIVIWADGREADAFVRHLATSAPPTAATPSPEPAGRVQRWIEGLDDCPVVAIPTRLLAVLLEYDPCTHVADYVCSDCTTIASDMAISILEGTLDSTPAPGVSGETREAVVSLVREARALHHKQTGDYRTGYGEKCSLCSVQRSQPGYNESVSWREAAEWPCAMSVRLDAVLAALAPGPDTARENH